MSITYCCILDGFFKINIITDFQLPLKIFNILSEAYELYPCNDKHFDVSYTIRLKELNTLNRLDFANADSDIRILDLDRKAYWQESQTNNISSHLIEIIETGIIYEIFNRHLITIYGNIDSEEFIFDIVRSIFAVTEVCLLKKNFIRVHGALVSGTNTGIVLIGGKKSGKTTTLCSILDGISNSRIGANDKYYLNFSENCLLGVGSIEYIGIRKETLSSFTNLSSRIDWSNDEMSFIWTHDFAKSFGSKFNLLTTITHYISLKAHFDSLEISSSNCISVKEKELLLEGLFEFSDDTHLAWLVQLLLSKEEKKYHDELINKCRQILINKPIFEVQVNPYSLTCMQYFDKLLNQ